MPNRILKESICTSDTIDQFTWFEESLFYRLIVNCDDYGRFDGRPAIIKNRLFPLKENLTLKAVSAAINTLANAGIITLYEFEGKPYLYITSWHEHQSIRAQKSKYPSPDCGTVQKTSVCLQLHANEINCKQMQANVPVIQSNTNTKSESESYISGERGEAASPPAIGLPLNDGSDWPVFQNQIDEWSKLYQAVDVNAELRKMRGWLLENQTRRKTKRGIGAFVVNWLSRQQDKGGARSAAPQPAKRVQEQQYSQRHYDPAELDDIPEEQLEEMGRLK